MKLQQMEGLAEVFGFQVLESWESHRGILQGSKVMLDKATWGRL
jgi:hypothetical protein